jgi:hypothetical protein
MDRPRIGHQPLYILFEFLIVIRSSDSLYTKNTSNLFLSSADMLCVRKPPFFSTNRPPKNVETIHFMFGRFDFFQTGAEYGYLSTSVDFSSCLPKNEKIGGIFVIVAQNVKLFSKIKEEI